MATKSTPVGFSLNDFLTRIVPGSVIVAPALIGFYVYYPELFSNISAVIALVALTSFLSGELVEHLRNGLFRVPTPFRYLIYLETGDMTKMPSWFKYEVKARNSLPVFTSQEKIDRESYLQDELKLDFRNMIEEDFDVDFDSNRPRDIYDFLILALEPSLSPRTRRHRSLYAFSKNLQIATVIAIFLYLGEFALNTNNGVITIATVSLFGITILILVFTSFLSAVSHIYFESLLKEYYVTKKDSESR